MEMSSGFGMMKQTDDMNFAAAAAVVPDPWLLSLASTFPLPSSLPAFSAPRSFPAESAAGNARISWSSQGH